MCIIYDSILVTLSTYDERQFPSRSTEKRTHEFNLERTTFSQSSRQSTSAPSLEAKRKAPLNFLLRLYVSLGGGVNLFASMTGIKPLTSDVTAAHSVPGPNEKGCFVAGRNGIPRDDMDLTCALSITYLFLIRPAKMDDTETGDLVLSAGEIPKL